MKKNIKKILAIVLSVAVAVAMLPSMALAESEPAPAGVKYKRSVTVDKPLGLDDKQIASQIVSMIDKAVELIENGKVEAAVNELTRVAKRVARNPRVKGAVENAFERAIDLLVEEIGEENIDKIKEQKEFAEIYVQQLSARLPQIYAEFEKDAKECIKAMIELTEKQIGDVYNIIDKNIDNPEAMIAEIVNYLREQGCPEDVVNEIEKQLNNLLNEVNKKVAEIQAQIESFCEIAKEKLDKFYAEVQKVIEIYNYYKAIYDKLPKSYDEWKAIIQGIVDEICKYADTATQFINAMTASIDYSSGAAEGFDTYKTNAVLSAYVRDCSMLINTFVGLLGDLPEEIKEFIAYDKVKTASENLLKAGEDFYDAIELLGDKVGEDINTLNNDIESLNEEIQALTETIEGLETRIADIVSDYNELFAAKDKLEQKYSELYTKVYSKVLPLKKGQNLLASKNIKFRKGVDFVKSVKTSNKKAVKVYKKAGKYYIQGIKANKSATITVKFLNNKSITYTTRSYKVTVQKKAVQPKTLAVKYNGKTIKGKVLKKGSKIKLTVSKTPVSCVKKAVFKSSNKKVVKAYNSGIIKANKKGYAKVTVKVGNKKSVIKFKVK